MQRKRKLAEKALWPMGDSMSDVLGLTPAVASLQRGNHAIISTAWPSSFAAMGWRSPQLCGLPSKCVAGEVYRPRPVKPMSRKWRGSVDRSMPRCCASWALLKLAVAICPGFSMFTNYSRCGTGASIDVQAGTGERKNDDRFLLYPKVLPQSCLLYTSPSPRD